MGRRKPPRQPEKREPCPTGKVRYHGRGDAERALATIAEKGVRTGRKPHGPRNAYFCKTCRGWHLTSWTPEEHVARRDMHRQRRAA